MYSAVTNAVALAPAPPDESALAMPKAEETAHEVLPNRRCSPRAAAPGNITEFGSGNNAGDEGPLVVPALPESRQGEIYELGAHRLGR